MHHVILGPGGVGGLIAAALAKLEADVTLVLRPEALASYPSQLHLESPYGTFSVPVKRTTQVPSADVLWIAVKATQLESSLRSLPDGDCVKAIVPLLNGVDHVPMLRSRYGADRVIPATIGVESERIAPGQIVHRSPFVRLNVASVGRPLLQNTLDALQAFGFTCAFLDNEQTMLWGKLVFLGPLALTTTAAAMSIGEVASDPAWRDRRDACVREACAVARAEGATIDEKAVFALIDSFPANMRSSMQKDVEQGNVPELDAIAGSVLRAASRHKLAVPVTQDLVTKVEGRMQKLRSYPSSSSPSTL